MVFIQDGMPVSTTLITSGIFITVMMEAITTMDRVVQWVALLIVQPMVATPQDLMAKQALLSALSPEPQSTIRAIG